MPLENEQVAPVTAGMGEFSRLTGVFFEPSKTFADIVARPSWIVPMLLVIVASLSYTFVLSRHVGFDRIVRQSMENNSRIEQMSPEQREQTIAMSLRIASISAYAGPVVAVPVYYVVSAGVLMGILAGLLSAQVKFKQVFAVMAYSGMPGVIFSILAIVVVFLKNPDELNAQNPLAFNPAAFLDPQNTSKFLYSLAGAIDLFSIWAILLIATGLKAAAGKTLSFGGALFAVALPWAVFVLGRAALAGMFS